MDSPREERREKDTAVLISVEQLAEQVVSILVDPGTLVLQEALRLIHLILRVVQAELADQPVGWAVVAVVAVELLPLLRPKTVGTELQAVPVV